MFSENSVHRPAIKFLIASTLSTLISNFLLKTLASIFNEVFSPYGDVKFIEVGVSKRLLISSAENDLEVITSMETGSINIGASKTILHEFLMPYIKEFHKKYYHPSNSYIVVYGNCNMEETLKWLDEEYLSKFDKINVDSKLDVQKPFDKINEKVVLYPVSKEQGTDNKTLMSYNVAFGEKTPIVDLMGMDILTQVLLQSAAAPLKKALLDDKIGDVVSGDFDSGILQPVLFLCLYDFQYEPQSDGSSVNEKHNRERKPFGIQSDLHDHDERYSRGIDLPDGHHAHAGCR